MREKPALGTSPFVTASNSRGEAGVASRDSLRGLHYKLAPSSRCMGRPSGSQRPSPCICTSFVCIELGVISKRGLAQYHFFRERPLMGESFGIMGGDACKAARADFGWCHGKCLRRCVRPAVNHQRGIPAHIHGERARA